MGPHTEAPVDARSAPDADPEEPRARGRRLRWLEDTPFWALSALLHLALLLVALEVIRTVQTDREAPDRPLELVVSPSPPKEPEPDPTVPFDVEDREEVDPLQEQPIPFVPLRPHPLTPEVGGRPDSEGKTEIDAIHPSVLVAIGVGGPLPGLFKGRGGDGFPPQGGPRAARDSVKAALDWLVRHQSPDGSWKAAGFVEQCSSRCRNLSEARYGDGRGAAAHDVGTTGLAMLAFTGFGATHRFASSPEYERALGRARRYLQRVQVLSDDPARNGRFGPAEDEQWIYDHAIATLAMTELLVLSRDVIALRRPVESAVRLCLRAQNDGFGWRYGVQPGGNDTSVTGWMVLALKTARLADLPIPQAEYDRAFAGALSWLDRATAASGKTGYISPGDEGSRLVGVHPDPYPFSKEPSCMTAVGVLCRLFGGEPRRDRTVRAGVRILAEHPPLWREAAGRSLSTINLYYWYYASYALFQYGGPEWSRWNEALLPALLKSQRRGGCEHGSWDPIGEWGPIGGRVYSTALGAMTLEVYYRYRRIEDGISLSASR